MKKRIACAYLAMLFLFTCPAAYAQGGGEIAYKHDIRLEYWMTPLQNAADLLPAATKVYYYLNADTVEFSSVDCPVSWDIPPIATPTDYTVTGTIDIPEWLNRPDGFSDAVVTLKVRETLSVDIVSFQGYDYYTLPIGGDPLSLGLPGKVQAGARYYVIDLNSNWDFSAVNPQIPGRYPVTTRIALPDGYVYSGASPMDLTVYVIVYDPQGQPTEAIDSLYGYADWNGGTILVPQGIDDASLEAILHDEVKSTIGVYKPAPDFMTEIIIPIGWDLAKVNTGETGEYNPFYYELPNGFYLAEESSLRVQVVDREFSDLSYVGYDIYTGTYIVRWWKQLENPIAWYGVDGGEWSADEHGLYTNVLSTELHVHTTSLEAGHVYSFRVHDGDSLSNVLVIDLTDGKPKVSLMGGDNDGGDRGEQLMDDIEQPAPGGNPVYESGGGYDYDPWRPEVLSGGAIDSGMDSMWWTDASSVPIYYTDPVDPGYYAAIDDWAYAFETVDDAGAPYTAAQEVGPLYERVTDTETALSGLRLMEMMRVQPQSVLFQKGLISLWIPTERLAALAPGERELFSVSIASPHENAFEVWVAIGGHSIENIAGMRLRVPLPMSDGAGLEGLSLKSDAGHAAYDLEYDDALKFLTATIDHSGIYKIYGLPEAAVTERAPYSAFPADGHVRPTPVSAPDPLPLLLAGCVAFALFACAMVFALWRRAQRI